MNAGEHKHDSRRLWATLIAPSSRLSDVTERRQAQLMSTALLVMIGVFLLLTARDIFGASAGYRMPPSQIVGYVLIIAAYLFSRSRFPQGAALIVVAMFPIVLFPEVITGAVPNPSTTLCLLVPGLLLGSIFLSAKGTALLAVIYIGGIMLMPTLAPEHVTDLVEVSGAVAVNALSAVLAVGAMHLRDLSERDRQADLRESESRFRTLTSFAPVGIIQVDEEGKCLFVNPRCVDMLGHTEEQLLERGWEADLHSEGRDEIVAKWRSAREQGQSFSEECRFAHPDGPDLYAQVTAVSRRNPDGAGGGYFVTLTDLTQRVRLEEQLRHAQKMEAIGRLAGGVAHDFNNLLTAILGSTSLVELQIGNSDPRVTEGLKVVRDAGQRAAALTRQLLLFARKQVAEPPRQVNLQELVHSSLRLLQRVLGEDIEVVTVDSKTALWPVLVDPGQFEQVLLNLAVNARDAMPRGGTLTLEARNTQLSRDCVAALPGAAPGDYVLIRATDTGVGMSSEVLSHLFEPFFTTKPEGKGTGLGLAVCHGIVTQSGGHIRAQSAPGKGTTFEVYVPRSEGAAEEASPKDATTAARGDETVLVVEDEELVRRVAVRSLSAYGYKVLTADGGPQAFDLLERHQGPVHLILCDVVMPRLSGTQVVARVRASHPQIRVLYTSGYNEELDDLLDLERSGGEFLAKPYSPQELASKVREVLDNGA